METLDITLPKSWEELSQPQLIFLLKAITKVNRELLDTPFRSMEDFSAQSVAEVATYCLLKWAGMKLVTPYADGWLIAHEGHELKLTAGQLAAATAHLSWIGKLPATPVRLEKIDGALAIDASLDENFSFDDWLSCEALWQGHQLTLNPEFLRQMAEFLYRKPDIRLKEHEFTGIYYWWAAVKEMCYRLYPNFFQPGPPGMQPSQEDIRRSMNTQIRALTKGDVTKEERVLAMPVHRALTELDALAREYEEFNRKYPSK